MKKISKITLTILALILFVATITTVIFVVSKNNILESKNSQNATVAQKIYVCSMDPQVIMDKPGNCPICGMVLTEKQAWDSNTADTSLNCIVRPVNANVLASVKTVCGIQKELPLTIEASGTINYDTRKINAISARFDGLIEKSYVKYQFQPIRKGQKIYDIYCPDIYKDHWNYILLLRNYPDKPDLIPEERQWLNQLGLTKDQIQHLIYSSSTPEYHLSVYSDVDGYAVSPNFNPEQALFSSEDNDKNNLLVSKNNSIGLNEGIIVETGTPLFKLISTETVRADLKIKTEDAVLLNNSQKVTLFDAISPEKKLDAIIGQIEPLNGGLFQLVKVYINDNENLLLPGKQIQAYIEAGKKQSLWIPKTAVVNLGKHQAVFLLQNKMFVATNIKTGLHSGDKIEVLSGIDEHSKVALNASLLTDSDGFIITN